MWFVDLLPVLSAIHAVAASVWVGAVFMGSIIDWPAARTTVEAGHFPFGFIVGQGNRVFLYVYSGMAIVLVSGIALILLHPPQTTSAIVLTCIKSAALLVMIANTLYGSLRTWPKLQFASHQEAQVLYRGYMIRAYITFSAGIVGIALGSILHYLRLV
jgi:uncharacterized membrane protein